MHQALCDTRQNTVVDEEIFLEGQARIARLQIARPVIINTMAKRQVLRPCGCTYRVELDKTQLLDGARQARRLEQGARNGVAA
ncbi:hypothetical protein J2T60_000555 [Natronospira proteinivora]|uniref:Uncharacterized protein n=1 Tax=Natronospira proteinivora TaxID=1807133 RepID=A0ABT1G5M6_9GAMM|nr:hypothetical protein [Natronospira proteinivora]